MVFPDDSTGRGRGDHLDEWLTARAIRSARPKPLRTSIAYTQLIHGEIGPADYARRLRESDVDWTFVRGRVAAARDAARDAHRAELSARRAELLGESAGARRAAGRPRHSLRTRDSHLALMSLLVVVLTAFAVVLWGDMDAIPALRAIVRSAGDILPHGLTLAMFVTSVASFVALRPLLRSHVDRN